MKWFVYWVKCALCGGLFLFAEVLLMESLKHRAKAVGVKQTAEAVKSGSAQTVYIAGDADSALTRPIAELCRTHGTELIYVGSKKELGRACGIDVPSAAAAVLKC